MAPFLHGAHYTSFGRHFTKSDKLKEVKKKQLAALRNPWLQSNSFPSIGRLLIGSRGMFKMATQ